MNKSFFFALTLALISAQFALADVPKPCTADDLALAKNYVDTAQKRYDNGLETQAGVTLAKVSFAEVSLCAGQLTLQAYCSSVPAEITGLVSSTVLNYSQAVTDSVQTQLLLNRLVAVRTACAKL